MAVIEEKPMQRHRAIERGEKERAGILCTGPYAYVLLDICKLVAGTAGLTGWPCCFLLSPQLVQWPRTERDKLFPVLKVDKQPFSESHVIASAGGVSLCLTLTPSK